MKSYSLSHLSDQVLLRDLATLIAHDRKLSAALLAHIAEVDERRLYLPAAYPSMFAYCVGELRLCEQAAFKRILAARAARRFPAIFDALAEGRLHLSAIVLIAPHLTEEAAPDLFAAATHKSKSEIEQLLAERFPRPGTPAPVRADSTGASSADQLSPGIVEGQLSPGIVQLPQVRANITPVAPNVFTLQLAIQQSTHNKLRYAQDLLSHVVPSGDIATVLDRALDALIGQLEKRKFAATSKPRHGRPPATGPRPAPGPRRATGLRPAPARRCIPAHIRRAVWERDGGHCTFVSDTGRRCESRRYLEFDHMDEVARGGVASVDRIRLRCRAHNQYSAECTFGAEFMRNKRQEAATARDAAKFRAAEKSRAATEAREVARFRAAEAAHAEAAAAVAAEQAKARDVVPWLTRLGFGVGEAREAAAACEDIPDAPLEERVRRALSSFHLGTKIPAAALERGAAARSFARAV